MQVHVFGSYKLTTCVAGAWLGQLPHCYHAAAAAATAWTQAAAPRPAAAAAAEASAAAAAKCYKK